MIEVRPAVSDDIPDIVSIFARAFAGGPLYRGLEPDDAAREGFVRMVFELRVPQNFESSEAEIAVEDGVPAGAAFWQKAGAAHAPSQALEDAVRAYGRAVYDDWRRFHEELFSMFDKLCPGPHRSLAPIAALVPGRGAGGALIRGKLPALDAEKVPCVLGTQDESNLAIYGKFGWKLTGSTAHRFSSGAKITSYCMTRPAGGRE